MAAVYETACCALLHLKVTPKDSLEEIKRALEVWSIVYPDGKPAPFTELEESVLAILTYAEEKTKLPGKLEQLDFRYVTSFPRTAKKGDLYMYLREGKGR